MGIHGIGIFTIKKYPNVGKSNHTGCLIRIPVMVYDNAQYNWVGFHPLYQLSNQFFSIAHLSGEIASPYIPEV